MPHVRLRLPAFSAPRVTPAPRRHPRRVFGFVVALTGLTVLGLAAAPLMAGAQSNDRFGSGGVHDPGVRGGPPGAGGPLAGVTANEQSLFADSKSVFQEIDSVSGAPIDGASGAGLGPTFNLDSCAGCHAFPDVGGTSPATNPQIATAHRGSASNPEDLSAFIKLNGPVREVRFKTNPDGTPDGGVHDLFTITGRSDASGCTLAQPDFKSALAAGNAIFRIPTPIFGAGLIESIADQTILDNENANLDRKHGLGISGRENREDNDGTITRFGWKAQNKSLQMFAGEAYNVEQGVTNQIFPDERDAPAGCQFNSTPEDHSTFKVQGGSLVSAPDDTISFRLFMRLLAPPARPQVSPSTAAASSIASGDRQFNAIGCALCHTPTLTTGNASSPDPGAGSDNALSHKDANLYSDLLVHNMGTALADGISQGAAGGQEFRSAPLWGLGQRIFFLHDGRTSDLQEAIQDHASSGSEANRVISAYNALSPSQRQDVLNFLRSL